MAVERIDTALGLGRGGTDSVGKTGGRGARGLAVTVDGPLQATSHPSLDALLGKDLVRPRLGAGQWTSLDRERERCVGAARALNKAVWGNGCLTRRFAGSDRSQGNTPACVAARHPTGMVLLPSLHPAAA